MLSFRDTTIAVVGGLVALLFAWALSRLLFRETARRRKEELGLLRRQLQDKNAEVDELETSRAELEGQLVTSLTLHLPTGLPNRTNFIEQLKQRLSGNDAKSRAGIWIVAVRLWQLEQLSHSLGASAAHELMKQAAARLQAVVGTYAQIARIGDRELGLFISKRAESDLNAVGAALLDAIEDRFSVCGQSIYLHAVLGIAAGSEVVDRIAESLDKASLAADEAIAKGEPWIVAREEAQEERMSMLQLEADLHKAIDGNEFRLHFQPIVSVSEGSIAGFEALLRWQHSSGSMINPDRFIPLAESLGQMPRISEWVLREGVGRAKQWLDLTTRPLYLSMNLTPRDLNPEFCTAILHFIEAAHVPAECVRVEVTETAVVRDFQFAARLIGELSERGVRVLLDDFGTGYSSLSYLREMPFHGVKVDKSFVHRMVLEARDFGLVRSIVSLVHYLEMECVAEGIETQEQLDLITMIDCDYWQGNLFSKPVPSSSVEALLQRHAPAVTGGFKVLGG
jgi:EAL domain-containing protein (putative c-di-GMP-specific phosphodiesterase class I)